MYKRIKEAVQSASEERDLDFNARVAISEDGITIDTRISRDRRRPANGGEYNYWLRVWPHRGNVLMQEQCSCDFWQPEDEPELFEEAWPIVVETVRTCAENHIVPVDG